MAEGKQDMNPRIGMRVKVVRLNPTTGINVDQRAIRYRRDGVDVIVKSEVAEYDGAVWLCEHLNGDVAAYRVDELEEMEPPAAMCSLDPPTPTVLPPMNYRQWLAGIAMQSLIRRIPTNLKGDSWGMVVSRIPITAWDFANGMIKCQPVDGEVEMPKPNRPPETTEN